MKVKELIEELSKYNPDFEVDLACEILPNCGCISRGDRCYCSYETRVFYLEGVSKKIVYNKQTKTKEVVGVSIRGH